MTARLPLNRQRPLPVPGRGTHHRLGHDGPRMTTEEWTA